MSDSLGLVFDHVHLYCSDPSASERWFVDGLGADLVEWRTAKEGRVVELRLGGATVLLLEKQNVAGACVAGPAPLGTNHFGFIVKDLDAVVARLRARGVRFESDPWQSRPGTRVAFAQGPDGVRVELLQREPPA